MSSFICEKCGKTIQDTPKGYITECEHYPIEQCNISPDPKRPFKATDTLSEEQYKEIIKELKKLGGRMKSAFKEAFENNEKIKIGKNWYKLIAIETHEDYKFSEFLIVEKTDPVNTEPAIEKHKSIRCPRCSRTFQFTDNLEKDPFGNIGCEYCGGFFDLNDAEVIL